MKNYLQIVSLVALALGTAACGTLHDPVKNKNCRAACERDYSMNKVEYNSCMAKCNAVDDQASDVDTRASNTARPSDSGRHN